MTFSTTKGRELALKLAPAIGNTNAIQVTCSRICRAAATLHRLNEEACNGHPANADGQLPIETVTRLQSVWEARVESQTARTLYRLEGLVGSLPHIGVGPWTLKAEEDPRGCSAIVAPGDDIVRGDSWGDRNAVTIP